MEHRFRKFFRSEEELNQFAERTVNAETYINMKGHPTKVYYGIEAGKANLPYEMRFTHPYCLVYDGISNHKKPRMFTADNQMIELENSRHTLK